MGLFSNLMICTVENMLNRGCYTFTTKLMAVGSQKYLLMRLDAHALLLSVLLNKCTTMTNCTARECTENGACFAIQVCVSSAYFWVHLTLFESCIVHFCGWAVLTCEQLCVFSNAMCSAQEMRPPKKQAKNDC